MKKNIEDNEYEFELVNEEMLEDKKHYFNYNAYKIDNKVDEDLITSIKKEYNVGTREAKRYNEVLTEPQREYIKKRWADYIAFMKNK